MGVKRSLLKGGATAFLLNGLGKALHFVAAMMMTNWLSAEGYGVYSMVLAVATITGLVLQLGLHTVVVRRVAAYRETGNWDGVRGVIYSAGKLALMSSVAGMLAWTIVAKMTPSWSSQDLRDGYLVGAALLPLLVLSGIRWQALRGLQQIFHSRFPEAVLVPIVLIVGTFVLTRAGAERAEFAVFLHLAALVAAFVWGAWALSIQLAKHPAVGQEPFGYAELLKQSWPILIIVLSQQLVGKLDLVVLGYFGSMDIVGVYAIVIKIGLLVSFGLSAVNIIAAPMMAAAYEREDTEKLQQIAAFTSLVSTVLSTAVLLLLLLGGEFLLQLFGSEFAQGRDALIVVTIGQLISCIGGANASILTMSGHGKEFSKIILGTALLYLFLCFSVIPAFGIMGAAVCNSVVVVTWNIAAWWRVRKVLGVETTFLGLWR